MSHFTFITILFISLVSLTTLYSLSSVVLSPYPPGYNGAPEAAPSLYSLWPLQKAQPFHFKHRSIHTSRFSGNFISMPDARHLSVYPSQSGCPGKQKTSENMMHRNCSFAMNAGFFDVPTGGCLGQVVSDGNVIHRDEKRAGNANFGITKDGKFFSGYLAKEDWHKFEFEQLVTGVLWLVKDGKMFVNESIAREHPAWHFCEEAAPRVSVGHDKEGNLLMLQLNGDEWRDEGPSVWDMAHMMIELGAHNAVNLDGGGSATAVLRDEGIVSKCTDYCQIGHEGRNSCPLSPGRCERNVTTILCGH